MCTLIWIRILMTITSSILFQHTVTHRGTDDPLSLEGSIGLLIRDSTSSCKLYLDGLCMPSGCTRRGRMSPLFGSPQVPLI
jgi:hypothetical protein